MKRLLLRCMSLLLAPNGHPSPDARRPRPVDFRELRPGYCTTTPRREELRSSGPRNGSRLVANVRS